MNISVLLCQVMLGVQECGVREQVVTETHQEPS